MLSNEYLRVRGGYNNKEFISNLTTNKVFDDGRYNWQYLTLYHYNKMLEN